MWKSIITDCGLYIFILFFLAFDFCRFCMVIHFFSSPPQRPMTSDFDGFLYQILSITLFSYLISWERASISLFQCSVLNKGTTGTIFITSLVWRGPWLGIEPGTLPLGYRGGGHLNIIAKWKWIMNSNSKDKLRTPYNMDISGQSVTL